LLLVWRHRWYRGAEHVPYPAHFIDIGKKIVDKQQSFTSRIFWWTFAYLDNSPIVICTRGPWIGAEKASWNSFWYTSVRYVRNSSPY
jgi:hypothetical protein